MWYVEKATEINYAMYQSQETIKGNLSGVGALDFDENIWDTTVYPPVLKLEV